MSWARTLGVTWMLAGNGVMEAWRTACVALRVNTSPFFFFFFSFGHAHGIQMFPGQGSNPGPYSDPNHRILSPLMP